MYNFRCLLIGGTGKKTEVDETVLCRRGVIRNPSSSDDDIKDTVWILGIIDSQNKDSFYVKRIENRRIKTITEALEDVVGVGSILASDGYPSYPSVAANLGLVHKVINHSEGFKSKEGVHTKNIEIL